jgi:uncharacterized membrane protein
MRRIFIYLLFYSIGGFILERIINVIALGYYYDNSVLYGPYQPLYGAGVVMAIIVHEIYISKTNHQEIVKSLLLLITAIITTAISEAVTGYGYEFLTGDMLWDYRLFFPCNIPYVCIIPTTLFGIGSFLVIKYLHPYFKIYLDKIPKKVSLSLLILFVIDIILTIIL